MDDMTKQRLSYPRVSDIISKQTSSQIKTIPIEKLTNASLRGIHVHQYCTTYLEKLFMPEIEAEYLPYVDTFIEWAARRIKRVIMTCERLYDDDLKFSGEFDAIVIMNDSPIPTLIDIKATCTSSKAWPLQLAAYEHLCKKNNIHIGRAMNIHIKKTTKKKIEEIQGKKVSVSIPVLCAKELPQPDSNASWEIFSNALACYDYFDRKEIKEESECSHTN